VDAGIPVRSCAYAEDPSYTIAVEPPGVEAFVSVPVTVKVLPTKAGHVVPDVYESGSRFVSKVSVIIVGTCIP
jgi:hypothetical protein